MSIEHDASMHAQHEGKKARTNANIQQYHIVLFLHSFTIPAMGHNRERDTTVW